jgi:signal transduction histidine kinase
VQIASALEPVQRLMRDYWRVSSLLVAAVALASVGLGYAFSRYALRPTATIARTAHRIDADNLGERIPVPAGGSELADLARLLNRMFDRLEASFAHARRFSADVSHELKTPLSLVRLNAEKLRPSLAADTEASARLDDLIEETGRLHTIIERLLFIAKAESGTLTLARQARDAQAVVAGFAEDAQALAEDAGVRFELAANDPGPVHCDPGLVRQLLLNLLTNALKVSPPGGVVALASRTAGGWWQLEVSDSGPGLPPGELERVFQRFVRYHRPGGPPPEPGHGLGLAICRSIAELHHGRIRAENRPGGGLSVIVEIPASS